MADLPKKYFSGGSHLYDEDGLEKIINEIRLKSKYLLAVAGRVHMNADDDFAEIGTLASTATLLQACVYANALKQSQLQHYADAGAAVAIDASHLYADDTGATTLNALPDLTGTSTLDDLSTRLSDLDSARFNHASAVNSGNSLHVHFKDDVAENDEALTYPPDTVAHGFTLAKAITDLNDLRRIFSEHFARASE